MHLKKQVIVICAVVFVANILANAIVQIIIFKTLKAHGPMKFGRIGASHLLWCQHSVCFLIPLLSMHKKFIMLNNLSLCVCC